MGWVDVLIGITNLGAVFTAKTVDRNRTRVVTSD
jgi:hypothetical protein